MMRFNIIVGAVRTQVTNTQKMNNYDMSTQNIPNPHACSLGDIKSNGDIANAWSLDDRKSKIVHISANTIKVEDAKNETKD